MSLADLSHANRSDRNELRSPDTVRYKRAVRNLLLVPRVINDITDEPRSFGKFLSLSTVSSFCLISSEFALTVFRWGKRGLVDRFHERQIESRSVLR